MVIGTNNNVGGALAKIWIVVLAAHTVQGVQYLGKFLGKLTELHHGVSGEVYAVDARTLHIKDFTYDGQAPTAYFYVGDTRAPSSSGFRLRDENGNPDVIRRYRGESITLTLPDEKSLANIKWFSVWCEEFSVNFGDVKIPPNFDYPRPQKIDPLKGVHGISSDGIVIVDAQTLLIPHLSYDGEAPDAKFWVGRGPKPSPQGIRVPDENGKEVPLRRYDRKTVVLTLPGELTIFDIGHFGIWCEAFTVDFGHIQIPSNLNVPPSLKMLGVSPQSKLNCEILLEERAFEVRWAVAGESIVLQLVAKLEDGEYMSFGLSGEDHASIMIGGDVVVAWVDKTTLKGYADDYYLSDKSQCAGYTGSCPDQLLQNGADAVRVLNAALVNGYSIVTYQRTLLPHDRFDSPIFTNQSQPIIWAIGPLNQRNQVSFHSRYTKGTHFIDFGRPPKWSCPSPESEDSRSAARRKPVQSRQRPQVQQTTAAEYEVPETTIPPTPRPNQRRRGEPKRRIVNNGSERSQAHPPRQRQSSDEEINAAPPIRSRQPIPIAENEEIRKINPAPQRHRQTRRRNGGEGRNRGDQRGVVETRNTELAKQTTSEAPRREPPTPAPAEKVIPWNIPAIQCYEPEDGVFYAQMGPTGGKRGYPAITGHVGWGISWYINGLLIPEINVVRGKTYTFVVEGGDDENTAAKYHPFYITDDSVGGYAYKTPEERAKVRIFAGAIQISDGTIKPTGTGRLCHWTYNGDLDPEDYPSFGAYQRNLELKCEQGEPGIVQWTPDKLTPDTVYYQCFTHRYLGWRINVLDSCDELTQASEFHSSVVLPPKDFKESEEYDLEGDATYRVATIIKLPPGFKNNFNSFGKNNITSQLVSYTISENGTNTKGFQTLNVKHSSPMYVSHPNTLNNQDLTKPLFYADLEKGDHSLKPLQPSPLESPLNPTPLNNSVVTNDSRTITENSVKLSPFVSPLTTENVLSLVDSQYDNVTVGSSQHKAHSHVVKKMIKSPQDMMKSKHELAAKKPFLKIIRRPISSTDELDRDNSAVGSNIKGDFKKLIQEKPQKVVIKVKLNNYLAKLKEPFVELSPMQPSTERVIGLHEDDYYLRTKYRKMHDLNSVLGQNKSNAYGFMTEIKKESSRDSNLEKIRFIPTPFPKSNATTLKFATNTGFNPRSIVFEGGFKPIRPSPQPQILDNYGGPEIESESEIGVLKVPLPVGSDLTYKGTISRRYEDSIYNTQTSEIRRKRQKSNLPKYLPYEDSVPESAEHVNSYYLPPHSSKKPSSDTGTDAGVFISYDGKRIHGSTLTVRLDEQNNVIREKMSKAAALVRAGPQSAPFKGELPPLDPKIINSFGAQTHQSSLSRNLETPNHSSRNDGLGITKLKLVPQSRRNKREAHHTPEHTAQQMAMNNNNTKDYDQRHQHTRSHALTCRPGGFTVSFYVIMLVILYQFVN